ncbi:hypothetical protein [Streptomyces sp. NPDC013740]|uniref:hypothetical protein n=1 Tax=Streptomyces sp. NPDC013740 TaxID=3364867 RepID=UPI00370221B1
MDVEEIAGELYGLKPGEFTAARDAYVDRARKARDPEAAKAIAALRKPVAAVWAANLLARRQPEAAEGLLALGRTLREAHRTLDAEQLRAASAQQHQLVTALARTAADLAAEAGQPVSDAVLYAVEQILHAVLARPDVAAQWAAGRLAKVPEATVGFPAVAPEAVAARPAPARARAEKPPKEPAKGPPKSPPKASSRLRDLEVEQARAAAADADAEAARRAQELAGIRTARQGAVAAAEEAGERVRALEHDLREARRRKQQAAAEATKAAQAVTAAEESVREARRAAERARREVERLER